MLEEKLDAFQGGISSGGIRAAATNALKRIIQVKAAIRRTVPRAPPPPPVVAPVPVPVVARVPVPVVARVPVPVPVVAPVPARIVAPVPVPVVRPDPIDAAVKSLPEVKPVSLWSNLGKAVTKGVTAGITQRVGQKIAPAAIAAPVIGVAGRVLPAIGRVMTGRTATAAATGLAVGQMLGNGNGGGSCPVGFHPNKQDGVGGPRGTYCVRNRRMNFGNARAARRGVRRLKGARKLLRDIERLMPTKTSRRRAPAHHHHPAAGG